ncbi:uncharacterized protein SCHCODRAFT_02248704 [Schizophyllum commune H4-8]|uniref:uncharacterized protein n=1 Tax=Schizophyllum commune (strain H4-8 / FGSC 9210) TaxID=578458 RepID=UPI00215E2D69|nr:uncharacterized protein SCHCODRAFT_02248704 [Schizophyllum commune H4-8]KAI5893270.1 hypothetical protein SCHCODRAFT_02248704 [Schizophyllum commune H4-8]
MLRKSFAGSALTSAGNPPFTLCSRRFTTAGGVGQLPETVFPVSPRVVRENVGPWRVALASSPTATVKISNLISLTTRTLSRYRNESACS